MTLQDISFHISMLMAKYKQSLSCLVLAVLVDVANVIVALASLALSHQVIYLSCVCHWGHLYLATLLAAQEEVPEVSV